MKNVIKFSSPAKDIVEACLIGNGALGGVVFGDAKNDRIALNLDTLWSGYGKLELNKNSRKYLPQIVELIKNGNIDKAQKLLKKNVYGHDYQGFMPLGDLLVKHKNACDCTNYVRLLNLDNAIASAEYKIKNSDISKEYFCSNPDNAICFEYKSTNKDLDCEFTMQSKLKYKSFAKNNRLYIEGYAPANYNNFTGAILKNGLYFKKGKVIHFKCGIAFDTDGEISFRKSKIKVAKAKYIKAYIVADTTFNNKDLSLDIINKALDKITLKKYEEIREIHIKDYQSIYNLCKLELCDCNSDDTAWTELNKIQKDDSDLSPIQKLFNYGRYLMISSSRNGTLPMNMQGIWNIKANPVWYSAFTTNINLQMMYWGADNGNLGECVNPYLDYVIEHSKHGAKTARELYDSSGWCSFHNADIWHHTAPVGRYALMEMGQCNCFLSGAGWLCLGLYEHYQYTQNIKYLEKIYPVMKGAVEFLLDNLYECDGELVLIPSASAENKYKKDGKVYAVCKGSTFDMSITKQLFIHILEAIKVLKIDKEFGDKVKDNLSKLPDFKIDSKGRIVEFDKEYEEVEPHHRHISHLYGMYPATLINPREDKKLVQAVVKSLESRGDEGTGWSMAWKTCQRARLKDGNHAYKLIVKHLNPIATEFNNKTIYNMQGGTFENYLCAHPPFQVDGNMGIMSAIIEMLMQSHFGVIELLPAIPDRWHSGKVYNLVAKGNYKVSIEWSNNKVTKYKIDSKRKKAKVLVNGNILEAETNKWIEC